MKSNSFIKKIFFFLSLFILSLNCFADVSDYENLTEAQQQNLIREIIEPPVKYTISGKTPKTFVIKKKVSVDTQHGVECAACSSAYVLRFYGEKSDGVKLYHSDEFPCKFKFGTYPKAFREYFEPRGYRVSYYTGGVEDLKNAVSKGKPVIVMLSFKGGILHYVPVVGYDENFVFVQDSVEKYRNCREKYFNERIDYESLDKMWNVDLPYCSRMFVVIEK